MAKPSERTKLVDLDELLHRRVHPTQIKDGRPSKTTFLPRPTDKGELSVERGAVRSPAECYAVYAAAKGFGDRQGGIWSVSVAECVDCSLTSLSDALGPEEFGGPNPAHALIDMSSLTEEATVSAATALYAYAKKRGRLAPD